MLVCEQYGYPTLYFVPSHVLLQETILCIFFTQAFTYYTPPKPAFSMFSHQSGKGFIIRANLSCFLLYNRKSIFGQNFV